MELTIKIKMDNAAFGDTYEERAAEVERILPKAMARAFGQGVAKGYSHVIDTNGNIVGNVMIIEG